MSISVRTINHLITLSRWSFKNAKDNVEIQEKIKDYGYDVMRMESLITLNGQMDIKYLEQQKIRAEQDAAFKDYSEQYDEERKQCKHLRLLVRRVIPENEFEKYKRLLGIDERLKETFEGFSEQARKLYTHCQDEREELKSFFKQKQISLAGGFFRRPSGSRPGAHPWPHCNPGRQCFLLMAAACP